MAIDKSTARKIADAKTTGGGTPIKAGRYVLVVKQVLCDDAFHSGMLFIPEFDVVEAAATVDGVTPNPVGSGCSCAWPVNAGGDKGSASLGNIKNFCRALLGLPEESTTEEIMEKIGPYAGKKGDPDVYRARGMLVYCETRRKTIKSGKFSGKEADFPHFEAVSEADGNAPSEVAKRRKELDAAKR